MPNFYIKYIDEFSSLILVKLINPDKIYRINIQEPKDSYSVTVKEYYHILGSCILKSNSYHFICFLTNSKFIFFNIKNLSLSYEELNHNYNHQPIKIKSDNICNRIFVFYEKMIKVFQVETISNQGKVTVKVNFYKNFDMMGDNKNILKSNFNYPYGLLIFENPILRVSEFTSSEEVDNTNNIILREIPKNFRHYFLSYSCTICINTEEKKSIYALSYLSNILFFSLEKDSEKNKFTILKLLENAHTEKIVKLKKLKINDDNFYLLSYDESVKIKFWSMKNFKNIHTINTDAEIKNLYFSEKRKSLILLDQDSLIKIWQLEDELN
jgi:hypothetical protein